MKEIPLSTTGRQRGRYVAIVSDEDYEYLMQWRWTAVCATRIGKPFVRAYRQVRHGDKTEQIYMHRAVWERANGQSVPADLQVDHLEHGAFGCLDNRRSNLRLANQVQQNGNRRTSPGKSSRYKGVSWDVARRKWFSKITVDYRTVNLGRFDSERAAAHAYDIAARERFGEFARLNLVQEAV